MNKRNKDLLKLTVLFKKLTSATFSLGRRFLNKLDEKIFLRDLRKIDSSLYVFKSSIQMNYAVGFRTFYCGVNTYVPPEFKNHWISDHHVLSIFYKFGILSFNLIPYDGKLYKIQFSRMSIPYSLEINKISSMFDGIELIDGIKNWVELFYQNNDENILFNQGLVFPKFNIFDRDSLLEVIRLYQLSCGLKYVANARKNLINSLENAIASII